MKCPKCCFDNPPDTSFCGKCAAPLHPSNDAPLSLTETLESPTRLLARGTTFAGRYEIIEELGRGGMGKVYRVEDKKLKTEIALKIIRPEIASEKSTIERFGNELKTARMISHRNVCRMFDLGEDKGTYFITMEYVPGEDLKSLIRMSKRLETGTAVSIARQVCEGLSEAHKLGIVHRDLKPNNIMIDRDGNARIMDFGIARSLQAKGITGLGVIIGTPEYMSPEQVEAKEVDPQSDIYSLGVILYEMVTGHVPFDGETPLSIAMKQKAEQPRDPRDFNAQVPQDLSRVILRCLEKEKSRRYQSAADLGADLERIEKGFPAAERIPLRKPITSREITVKFSLKKLFAPALILLAVAAGALIISRFVLKKKPAPISPEKKSVAVLPFVDLSQAQDHEYLCDGIVETLINALSRIKDLHVPARTSVFTFKGKHVDIREIGRRLSVGIVLEGSVQVAGDRLRITAQLVNVEDGYQLWSEKYERGLEDVFAIQDDIAQTIVKTLKIRVLGEKETPLVKHYTENREAYDLYLKGRYFWNKRGREELKKALGFFQEAIDKDPTYSLGYAGLADSYAILGNNLELRPDEAYPKAKAAALRALEIDGSLAEARTSLAFIRTHYDWDFPAAESEYRQAIEINPGYATAHHWYAFLLSYLGRHSEAIAEIMLARDLDPLAPRINANVGGLLFYARQYDRALAELEKALEFDPSHEATYNYLTDVYLALGRHKEAMRSIQKAGELNKGYFGYHLATAYVYAVWGKNGEAQKMLDRVLNERQAGYLSSTYIAAVYAYLGETDIAFTWLEKAFSERDGQLLYLKTSPMFDPLRNDPRFKQLLKRMGL